MLRFFLPGILSNRILTTIDRSSASINSLRFHDPEFIREERRGARFSMKSLHKGRNIVSLVRTRRHIPILQSMDEALSLEVPCPALGSWDLPEWLPGGFETNFPPPKG